MEQCVFYLRTASVSNVGEDKDSHKRQRSACLKYANENGLLVEEEFYDAGVPGKSYFHQRPGFVAMLEFCEDRDVKNIVFENASRLSREQFVQELGYRELTAKGFNLICSDSPDYFTDSSANPSANMIRQILGAVSEFEKNQLVFKLGGARTRKRAVNKILGYTTLDGRGKCEGRISYHQCNPELVRLAKKLARKNPKTGYRRSRRQIAMELQRRGFITSKGTRFGPQQIARFLHFKLPPAAPIQSHP